MASAWKNTAAENLGARKFMFRHMPLALPMPDLNCTNDAPSNPRIFENFSPDIKDFVVNPSTSAAMNSLIEFTGGAGNSLIFSIGSKHQIEDPNGRYTTLDLKLLVKMASGKFIKLGIVFFGMGQAVVSAFEPCERLEFQGLTFAGITDRNKCRSVNNVLRATPGLKALKLFGSRAFVMSAMTAAVTTVASIAVLVDGILLDQQPAHLYDCIRTSFRNLKKIDVRIPGLLPESSIRQLLEFKMIGWQRCKQ